MIRKRVKFAAMSPCRATLPLVVAVLTAAISLPAPASAEPLAPASAPAPAFTSQIDAIAREFLKQTGVPSISLAVARDDALVYAQAYGDARLAPHAVPATPAIRYGIGSVSKQFCAAAILLLAQDGKVRLDDPVGKYLPKLTGGDKITVRQLLDHTSGYRDYWPQDYVPDFMRKPTTADAILDGWARVPLDFEPGTDRQYANTNYTVAGRIVETVSGQGLMDFLQTRIFRPLGMTDVTECDTRPLAASDAAGYTRVALGPVRPAPKEGPGWLFAAGELAMTPSDLVRWDLALIDGKVLTADSLRQMTTAAATSTGAMANYGLGVIAGRDGAGRPFIEHGGEISGTITENIVWPEQHVALAIIVNADWLEATDTLTQRLAPLLLPHAEPDAAARAFFDGLRAGRPDAVAMSDNLRVYLTPEATRDAAAGLGPLGPVRTFQRTRAQKRGGMTLRVYHVVCAHGTVDVVARVWPDGKFEQFNVGPAAP